MENKNTNHHWASQDSLTAKENVTSSGNPIGSFRLILMRQKCNKGVFPSVVDQNPDRDRAGSASFCRIRIRPSIKKKICCPTFFVARKCHKFNIILFLNK
jgi:hypothetical protein